MTPSKILFLALSLSLWILFGCATPQTAPQSRIPETKTQVPKYETDEGLKGKIANLERELLNNINNTSILLQLSTLKMDVKDFDGALRHMEHLKTMEFVEEPRLYGSLANIYKNRKEYKKAKENFLIFKSLISPKSSTIKKIDQEIKQLNFIIESLANQYEINLRPFSSDINTENSEYLPQFTMDDLTIIFTRRFFNQEDLFIATKTDSGYRVEPLEEINTLLNEGAHTLSADGSVLIFTHCDKKVGYGSCDLYRSYRTSDGSWAKPANMGAIINTRHWDSQPSLSADGRTLFFASKRDGGYGGSDLWTSTIKEDGTWSKPVNLGSEVNTKMDDESPFIHPDGQTLFFRSKGWPGLGGHDIFRSTRVGTKWAEVVNLGSPINTTGEDGALVVSLDGTRGYYATDFYKKKQLDHLDLFEFDLPQRFRPAPMTFVKGRVVDEHSGMPISARVNISYLDGSSYATHYSSNINGEFLAAIPVGRPTLVNISADEYIFYSDHISYKEVKYSVDPYQLSITLSKITEPESDIKKSKPTILKNIFFTSGSAVLLPMSESEIDILYHLLISQPSVKIEISGHTDDVGSTEDNLLLSKQRAEAVRSALINKGIDGDRLFSMGYGEEKPIDTNDTPEGKSNNRRTEFVIIN